MPKSTWHRDMDDTNEKSSDFNEGTFDPEVEARLYSEIYYSNETWVQDDDAENQRDSELTGIEQEVPITSSTAVSNINNDTSNAVSRDNSGTIRKTFYSKCRPLITSGHDLKSKIEKSRYRIVNRASKKSLGYDRERLGYRPVDHENCTNTFVEDSGSAFNRESTEPLSREVSCARVETDEAEQFVKAQEVVAQINDNPDFCTAEIAEADRAEHNLGQWTSNERDECKEEQANWTNKMLKMKQADKDVVEIISDSDDSILEVPIPPREQPPVIHLVDSDDESGKRRCRILKSLTDRKTGFDDKTIVLNTTNAVTNCSTLGPSAPSREAIGTTAAPTTTICATSEDSMTESEAANWSNIAAKQANDTRIRNILSVDESSLEPRSVSCDRSTLDRDEAAPIRSSDSPRKTVDVPGNDIDSTVRDCAVEDSQRTKRKRRKGLDSNSLEKSNALEVPIKRNKNSGKTNSDKSLTEYFFKGMSKKLQAFYNDPWGTESLDLHHIQSTMSRNPRHWKICDADLWPVSKRRGKMCSNCGMNYHRGRRCLGKPTEPRCAMCGAKGHRQSRCPQTMCLTCGHKYMTFRPTCGFCSKLYCNMCNGTGHTHEECPDLWRRYHDTTSEVVPAPRDPQNIMKAAQDLSCCNCAKRGHDATMCNQLRWSQHFPTPMYVTSYTDGPIYPALYREPSVQDKNDSGYIECQRVPDVDVDDVNTTLPGDETNRAVASHLLFQCGNFVFTDDTEHHRVSKRLDRKDTADIHSLLAGTAKPKFLNLWLKSFAFNVRITYDHHESILLVIETNCEELIPGLEKLLLQWFSRTDDEKPYLVYDAFPYDNLKDTSKKLKLKVARLLTVPKPAVILKKIVEAGDILSRTCVKLNDLENKTEAKSKNELKEERRKSRAIRVQFNDMMKWQNLLITSLYVGSWVPGSDMILRSFRGIANQMNFIKQGIPIKDYMEIVYLNNEIFAFHMTSSIGEALRRATAVADDESNTVDNPRTEQPRHFFQLIDLNILKKAIGSSNLSGKKNNTVNDCGQSTASPILPANNARNDCHSRVSSQREQTLIVPPNVEEKHTEISNRFGFTAPFTVLNEGNETIMNNHNYTGSNESSQVFRSDDVLPLNSQSSLTNLNTKAAISKTTKKTDKSLVMNLSKNKRRNWRRSAREAIKLANSSNVNHLQKMARELKSKMVDSSFRKKEIKSLQKAVLREQRKIEQTVMKQ